MVDGLQDRTVLVTGGAGFIGGHLIERLLGSARLICLDKLTYAANRIRLKAQVDRGLEFHEVDLADASALHEIVQDCVPDVIFHLASESHVDRSIESPGEFIMSNVVGTHNLLEAVLEYWSRLSTGAASRVRLVHVSTDEVFGSAPPGEDFRVDSRYAPNSPYAASKASADHLARAWGKTYGVPVIVTNCSNNYGPYQFPEKLIPHAILRAIRDEPIPIYGDGSNIRDWIHVDDHVLGLVTAALRGAPGKTYFFGARSPLSNLDLIDRLCSVLDELAPGKDRHASRIEFVSDRPGHDQRYAIDPTSAERGLGWRADVNLETGLRSTVRWYLDNQYWCQQLLEAGYSTDRIGIRL